MASSGGHLYGLIATFDTPEDLVRAAKSARAEGYAAVEGYTPFLVDGLAEALGHKAPEIPWVALIAGILGGAGGFLLEWWVNIVAFPINIGGRPLAAWPAFALPAFELAVLGATIAVVIAMLAFNGLPRLHHPVFAARDFGRATDNWFFLCIEARDPRFDVERTRRFLEDLSPLRVEDVPQ